MVGYVQQEFENSAQSSESMKSFKANCFYGVQAQHYDIEKTNAVEDGEQKLKMNKIITHNSAANQDLKLSQTEGTPEIPLLPEAVQLSAKNV